MKLPVPETEFLETIENISKKLAHKFKFGYHDVEDMKQQIMVFALEGLRSYDKNRPLENFLWTHVRNRLFNFKRDNYQRPDKPCKTCPFFKHNLCTEYANQLDCSLYKNWYTRNNSKKNLMHLNTIEELKEYLPTNQQPCNNPEHNEIIDLIEAELNGEEREIYLRLKNGSKVNKASLNKLLDKIREIIVCQENEDN